MITKNIKAYIENDTLELSEQINVYSGDGDISINMALVGLKYQIDQMYSDLKIVKPDGSDSVSSRLPVVNNILKFVITQTMIDESIEVGEHKLQIRLWDSAEGGNRVALPAFSFIANKELEGSNVILYTLKDSEDNELLDVANYSLLTTSSKRLNYTAEQIDDSVSKKHTHSNSTILDGITSGKVAEWNSKSDSGHTHTGYATTTDTTNLNNNKFDDVSISGAELSLKANGVVKKTVTLPTSGGTVEGHTHANKATLDNITDAKVSSWDNKSNFSGSYNDLTNKPTLPTQVAVTDNLTSTSANEALSANQGKILDDKITQNTSSLEDITQDFNEHIQNHPSGGSTDLSNYYTKTETDSKINEAIQNGGIELIEPNDNDIPKVFLIGSNFGNMTNEKNEVTMDMEYISKNNKFKSAIKIKFQGTSSLGHPKKNFTIKMYEDSSYVNKLNKQFKGWSAITNKYVLKANYIDLTHARNVVSARLWSDVVKSRTDYNNLPTELKSSPNQGAVDGFFVKLYVNGVYQGRYTWNLGKDDYTYGVSSSNTNHCILCGENFAGGCFRELPLINGYDWSDELHDITPTNIKTSWTNAVNIVKNGSDADFKANLGNHFDVNSLIDYYCFQYFICGLDSMGKNQIYVTYNGIKWYACSYDMDSTWGLYWSGDKFVSPTYRMQEDYESGLNSAGNLLYMRLEQLFSLEIYNRYQQLRNSALSMPNIIAKFEQFMDICNSDLVKEDYEIFAGIPSKTTNTLKQIRDYANARAVYVDGKIAELNTTPIPITGLTMKVTTTINTGSTDTLLVAYIPSDTTQKGITWTTSNSSVATVSNGVVTGVANGTCTITATSTANANIKATCTVTVDSVNISVTSVSLDKSEHTMYANDTLQLVATVLPLNATNKNVTWSSSNTDIATVNNGTVTGVGIGSATITVTTTDGNKTYSMSLTIKEKDTSNLLNGVVFTPNKRINETDGVVLSGSNYVSDSIPVENGNFYILTAQNTSAIDWLKLYSYNASTLYKSFDTSGRNKTVITSENSGYSSLKIESHGDLTTTLRLEKFSIAIGSDLITNNVTSYNLQGNNTVSNIFPISSGTYKFETTGSYTWLTVKTYDRKDSSTAINTFEASPSSSKTLTFTLTNARFITLQYFGSSDFSTFTLTRTS